MVQLSRGPVCLLLGGASHNWKREVSVNQSAEVFSRESILERTRTSPAPPQRKHVFQRLGLFTSIKWMLTPGASLQHVPGSSGLVQDAREWAEHPDEISERDDDAAASDPSAATQRTSLPAMPVVRGTIIDSEIG